MTNNNNKATACGAGGSKAGGTVRGGGGICPAKGHAKYFSVDLAEAQDLARVAEGKTRILTEIPPNYRLEATGLRLVAGKGGNDPSSSGTALRATIGCVPKATGKPNQALTELERRTRPEWNGIHINIGNDQHLFVRIMKLTNQTDTKNAQHHMQWEKQVEVVLNPLEAFKVENQDVVWHKHVIHENLTLWVELSLLRKTSALRDVVKAAALAVKKKKKLVYKFNPKRRSPEEVRKEQEMLDTVIKQRDDNPMTPQDKVYMKDIWNKCLGWIEMTGEFIVDGLFLRCPDLIHILGKFTAELMFEMLIGIIDKAVRNLDPTTEVIARESYRDIPLSPPEDKPFKTLQEGFQQFANLGMRPRHWQEARAIFVIAMQKANPYLEEADYEILETGVDSCAFKFWNQHVMIPALQAIQQIDSIYESEENRNILINTMIPVVNNKKAAGMVFYKKLLSTHQELLPYFGTTDINFLAGHLFDAIELLVEVFNDFESALPVLNNLGKIHDLAKIPVWTYPAITEILDVSLRVGANQYGDGTPQGEKAVEIWAALINRAILVTSRISFGSERLIRKAFQWSEQVAHELKLGDAWLSKRKHDIEIEIRSQGTYSHTEEEIVHGARVAWRNSAKCVGRIAWNTMLVRDRRHVTDLDQMFAECIEHQRLATADGSLKAVMTVFKARQPGTRLGMRFWGLQLIRFACYEMPDGTLMGDRANLQYTKECIEFGWTPPEPRTEFDVLPVVIEDTVTGLTKMFEVPKEYHKVTMIEHPKFPEFAKLGLRWCVVPTVTCFTLTLGGLQYTCCPFNGWFMECEITRDLIEPGRMDKMEAIAKAIGVDSTDEDDFWRERVAHETNKAVVYSFRRDGNSIVDHVTAQAQFLAHDLREKREGRECPAQWSWVVPSSGGATMPIWHHEMRDFYVEPAYQYQAEVTALRAFSTVPEESLLASASAGASGAFENLLVLFGSVTGTAEGYAYKMKKMLRPLHVDVKGLDKVDCKSLWKEFVSNGGKYSALLVIVSTFGEGDPPTNAVPFFDTIKTLPVSAFSGIQYSVMAIGSRVYPDFCQAGIDLDYWFRQVGAEQILPLVKADELDNQAGAVDQWIQSVAGIFNVEQKKALILSGDVPAEEEPYDEGQAVQVTFLQEEDALVKEALEEEAKLATMAKAKSPSVGALARFLPDDGYALCQVTRNTELVDFSQPGSKDAYKSTRFLEFDLNGVAKAGDSRSLTYATGDHAKIAPCNPTDTVTAMCNCINSKSDAWVRVEVQEGMARQLPVQVARVGDILSMEIDLATQEKDGNLPLFEKLIDLGRAMETLEAENLDPATQDSLKKELNRLDEVVDGLLGVTLDPDDKAADVKKRAITNVMETFMDIPSILREYPLLSSKLTLADCVEVLPRLKPRYYSIASASELHPSRLQLTVGVLTVPYKSSGKVRNGICSNYLSGAVTSAEVNGTDTANFVRLGINTSTFRLPQDMSSPVLMVGPGTGISPMMGFLQAREKALKDGITLGPCMVFFGCRTEDDFLHSSQMREWEKSGVISSLQVAFSRLPGKEKEYVQHRISKIGDEVWSYLQSDKCHYYVCGDSNMAEDVYDELFRVCQTAGKLSQSRAWNLFHKMKEEHRFQADTWGVVMKRKEGLEKQAEKKYNQAAEWLKNVSADDDVSVVGSMNMPIVFQESKRQLHAWC